LAEKESAAGARRSKQALKDEDEVSRVDVGQSGSDAKASFLDCLNELIGIRGLGLEDYIHASIIAHSGDEPSRPHSRLAPDRKS